MVTILKTRAFAQWFNGLRDLKAMARIDARIRRLSLGNPGDVKSVGEGIGEMRIDHGPGYRIYFAQKGHNIVLLLCGGDKSSQARDISKAKKLALTFMKDL